MAETAGNPHFEAAASWNAARAQLTFPPREPRYTAGRPRRSLQIHVRDHKLRELPAADRTLEAHYGAFVVSQARRDAAEAQRSAPSVSYGPVSRAGQIAGHAARVYELGPEPPPDDIEGRSAAVVTWHDSEVHYLVASIELSAVELIRIANSVYDAGSGTGPADARRS